MGWEGMVFLREDEGESRYKIFPSFFDCVVLSQRPCFESPYENEKGRWLYGGAGLEHLERWGGGRMELGGGKKNIRD